MNMLDRVADAIRCATEENVYVPWEYMKEAAKKPWRERAKAALQALYEPDASMVTAGVEAYEAADPTDDQATAITNVWGAMIHAAAEGK